MQSMQSPEAKSAQQALLGERSFIKNEISKLEHDKSQLNSLLSTFGEGAPSFLEKQEILKDIKNIDIQLDDIRSMSAGLGLTGRIGRTTRRESGSNFARISE